MNKKRKEKEEIEKKPKKKKVDPEDLTKLLTKKAKSELERGLEE